MWRPPRTAKHNGSERLLSELAREHGIALRTLVCRLDRGVPLDVALVPPAASPRRPRRRPPPPPPSAAQSLVARAYDVLVDLRAVLAAVETTPRRERLRLVVNAWLRDAGPTLS